MWAGKTGWSIAMQTSFSDLDYAAKKKRARRIRFLGDIQEVMP
jgi:hypothetical protein